MEVERLAGELRQERDRAASLEQDLREQLQRLLSLEEECDRLRTEMGHSQGPAIIDDGLCHGEEHAA